MSRAQYPSEAAERFLIRMPDGMRGWIKEEARRMVRSANAQIIWMLQRQIDGATTTAGEKFGDRTPAVVPNATALPGGASTHAS